MIGIDTSAVWALFSWQVGIWLTALVIVLPVLPLVLARGAGLSAPSAMLYLKVSVEAIPLGNHRLVLVEASFPTAAAPHRVALGGLSHSALYETADAVNAVVSSIERFDRARRSNAPLSQPGTGSGTA
jgi:hypothetical protein